MDVKSTRPTSANGAPAFTGNVEIEAGADGLLFLGQIVAPVFVLGILKELSTGAIATQVIQAINRVRCRRVIDKLGNCEPTDVYLALPSGQLADDILELIKTSMPGVRVAKWAYSGSTRKPRTSKHAASLMSFLGNLLPGKTPVKEVLCELGIPKSSFEKLLPKLKDETHQLFNEMMTAGVSYQVEGAGRGQKTYFVKS
tara:strand:- start:712 stop:1308 length:597 start_codon:yes stop_codon:yes gene_type:complete